ncbi:MAG: hypothetical protein QE263_01920 [Vampirovibrionales bacterium]|nr:hypothetical protein [Vampirovibrionales bacterium]
MKILERINKCFSTIPRWLRWVPILMASIWLAHYWGFTQAKSQFFSYEEAQSYGPYWLEYYQYPPEDWGAPVVVALERTYQKKEMGKEYTWCLLYSHKKIANRKLVFLFPFYGEPDSHLLTKPINTSNSDIQKILQYTRYPECNPSIRIYNEEPPAL